MDPILSPVGDEAAMNVLQLESRVASVTSYLDHLKVADVLLHNLLLVDVVGPPSAEVCRTVANFPQVDDLRFINPWEA